jgi:FOG: FHA domain
MKRKLPLVFLCLAMSFFFLFSIPLYGQASHILSIKRLDAAAFPKVSVYFTLYDSTGIPTSELSKDNLELKENGKKVDTFSINQIKNTDIPKYITLLIDNSGSMKGDPLAEAKQAAKQFIDSLNAIDQVKIYDFNDTPYVLVDFTNDKNKLSSTIDSIEVAGKNTALNLAVYDGAKDLEAKPSGQRVIVLLTDGKDETDSIAQDDAIGKASNAKIPIYSVGFGSFFDSASKKYDAASNEALSRFSILTGGVFFIASQQGELAATLVKVSDLLKFQYVIEYTSTLPKDKKEYLLELKASVAGENLIETIPIVTPTYDVTLSLPSIADNQQIKDKTTITPEIKVTGGFLPQNEIKLVKYYLDKQTTSLADVSIYPFSYELDPKMFDYGSHTLLIKVYDSLDRSNELTKEIIFPAPPIYKNPIFYIPIAAVLLILAIVLPVVLVKKKKKKKASPDIYGPGYAGGITMPGLSADYDAGTIPQGGEDEEAGAFNTFTDNPLSDQSDKPFGPTDTVFLHRDLLKESVSAAWLAIIKGKPEGREYSVPPEKDPERRRVSVGRDTENDIVIDDPSVTRQGHFLIIIDKATYTIIDTGSTNGTYLNAKKLLAQKKLSDGDRITIGDTEMEFKVVFIGKAAEEKKDAKPEQKPKPKNKRKKKE